MTINRSVASLLCCITLGLLSYSAPMQAENNILLKSASEKRIDKINELMTSGAIKSAYSLAKDYQESDVLIRLKHAQLALMLGYESEANLLFTRLEKYSGLTLRQKENMKYFLARFNLSLKKKLRLINKQVKLGNCDQVKGVLHTLTQYQLTRKQAEIHLSNCNTEKRSISLRIGGLLGFDSNVGLANEELLPSSTELIDGFYQDWSLLIKSKSATKSSILDADKRTNFSWVPSYSFSSREYDQQIDSRYDYSSHKAQLELKMRDWFGFNWRLPVTYRYFEYSGKSYSHSYASTLSLSRRISQFKHQANFKLRHKNYTDPSNKDLNNRLFELGYQLGYYFKAVRIVGRVSQQELTGAKNSNDRYQSSNAGLKLYYRLSSHMLSSLKPRFFAGYSLKSRRYEGTELGLRREDDRQEYHVGISLNDKHWRVKTQFSYRQRKSNIERFDYQRNKIEIGAQYEF